MFPFHLKRRAVVGGAVVLFWLVCLISNSTGSNSAVINFVFNTKISQIITVVILIFWVNLPIYWQAIILLKTGFFTQELLLILNAVFGLGIFIYAQFYSSTLIVPLGLFLSIGSLITILWLLTIRWLEKKTQANDVQISNYYLTKKRQSHLLIVAVITLSGGLFFIPTIFDYPFHLTINSVLILIGGISVSTLIVPVLLSLSLLLQKSEKRLIIWKNADQVPRLAATQNAIFHFGNVFISSKTQVEDVLAARPKEVAYMAACLEKNIDHPVGQAIVKYAEKIGLKDFFASDVEFFSAMGAVGKIGGKKIAIGNMALMKQEGIVVGVLQREKYRLEDKGMEVLILGISSQEKNRLDKKPGEVLGMIVLKNEVRLSAKKIVNDLKKISVNLWVITAHSSRFVKTIAKEINLPEKQILSENSPDETDRTIGFILRKNSSKNNTIVVDMVLDKQSQKQLIDISFPNDTHHSVVIFDDNLALIAETIRSARKSMSIIERSTLVSLIYHGVIVILAIIGFINRELYGLYLPSLALVLELIFISGIIYYPFWVMKMAVREKRV